MTVGELKAKLNDFDDNLPFGYVVYNPHDDDDVLAANYVEYDPESGKVVVYE